MVRALTWVRAQFSSSFLCSLAAKNSIAQEALSVKPPTVVSVRHCLLQPCACCFGHACWRWPSGIQHLTESGPAQGQWGTEPVKWTFYNLLGSKSYNLPGKLRTWNLKKGQHLMLSHFCGHVLFPTLLLNSAALHHGETPFQLVGFRVSQWTTPANVLDFACQAYPEAPISSITPQTPICFNCFICPTIINLFSNCLTFYLFSRTKRHTKLSDLFNTGLSDLSL